MRGASRGIEPEGESDAGLPCIGEAIESECGMRLRASSMVGEEVRESGSGDDGVGMGRMWALPTGEWRALERARAWAGGAAT